MFKLTHVVGAVLYVMVLIANPNQGELRLEIRHE
jgi:hypothetical protein